MSWMDEVGLNDAASKQAYRMLFDAIAGGGNYDRGTTEAISRAHSGDVAMAGGGVPAANRSAFDVNVSRDAAAAAGETKTEAKNRSVEDLAGYGQTFQRAALENDVFQKNLQTGLRAQAREKKLLRKKKYGTMLKAIGAVASVFNPAIGMALAAGGNAMGAGSVDAPVYQKAKTSKIAPGAVASQAGSTGHSSLAPVAAPLAASTKPLPASFGLRIDPLTGLPY
jgi:hypothetical protein